MDAAAVSNGADQVQADLVQKVEVYVEEYMSRYDASHDYNHIKRVLGLSHSILAEEQKLSHGTNANIAYNPTLVTLGALLHDVGDRKYLQPGQDATTLVRDVLLANGCPAALSARVQDLVVHVSFSGENKDRQKVLEKIAAIPELAIVQDADRLDAIGAVGIGRCFAFTGARSTDPGGLDAAIEHFREKLLLLEGMMKTETGRRMAEERTERLRVFMGWWEDEVRAGLA